MCCRFHNYLHVLCITFNPPAHGSPSTRGLRNGVFVSVDVQSQHRNALVAVCKNDL